MIVHKSVLPSLLATYLGTGEVFSDTVQLITFGKGSFTHRLAMLHLKTCILTFA